MMKLIKYAGLSFVLILASCNPSHKANDQSKAVSFLNNYYQLGKKNWQNPIKMKAIRKEYVVEYEAILEPGTKEHQWRGKLINVIEQSFSTLDKDNLALITFSVGRNVRASCDIRNEALLNQVADLSVGKTIYFTAIFKPDLGGGFRDVSPHLKCNLIAIN